MVSAESLRSQVVHRSAYVGLLATAALALGGCGAATRSSSSSKFQGEQEQVAKVVDDLASDGRRKNASKICSDLLAPSLVAQIRTAGSDCEQEMKKAIDDADDFDLAVQTVRVTGKRAQARVRQGDHGPVATFSFVKANGGWRATSLG
jgi:polyhydroxyalkanoate synthesis regulator phasin